MALPVCMDTNVYIQEYVNAKLAKVERMDKTAREFKAIKKDKAKQYLS